MNKTTILILLCLCLSVFAQLPNSGPRCPKDSDSCDYRIDSDPPDEQDDEPDFTDAGTAVAFDVDNSDDENSGRCQILLYATGTQVYNRTLTRTRARDSRATLSNRANNNIDVIAQSGECYCWVNLFDGRNYQGTNIGFWVSTSGEDEIWLSDYRTFNQQTRRWVQWDRAASSYWIDCYFD